MKYARTADGGLRLELNPWEAIVFGYLVERASFLDTPPEELNAISTDGGADPWRRSESPVAETVLPSFLLLATSSEEGSPAGQAGPFQFEVLLVGGRRHLPVVSLRRAATGGQDHFLLPSDDGVLVQVSKATTNCLSSSQRWMLSPAAGSGHRGQSGVELNNDHRRLSTEAETSPKKLLSRLTLEEDCHERSGRHARSIS